MKRARILLATLAIVAIMAGVFSFKAMKPTSFHTFYSTGLTTINGVVFTLCTSPFQTTFTTVPNGNPFTTKNWGTTSILTSVCPVVIVYPVQ
jgi:hypothetical protein